MMSGLQITNNRYQNNESPRALALLNSHLIYFKAASAILTECIVEHMLNMACPTVQ